MRRLILLLSLLAMLLAGCGGGGGSPSQERGTATLRITWPARTRLIPAASESITTSFFNVRELIATQTVARPTSGNVSTLTFSRLPASPLRLLAAAYPKPNGAGVVQASASVSVNVVADRTVSVKVAMESTIVGILVSPENPTLTLGEKKTLVATPLNAATEVVLVSNDHASWSSSDPAVANVDNSGLVTAVANGSARITFKDAESGQFGTTVVTVGTGGGGGDDAEIVTLANAYLVSLTPAQRAATVVPYNAENAATWSDGDATPASDGTHPLRHGVAYSSLTPAQKAAWDKFMAQAFDVELNRQLATHRRAEEVLSTRDARYDGDFIYLGFVGTPSTTGPWMLQVGGHRYAANHTYQGAALQSMTPSFLGIEPVAFTHDGVPYAPMDSHRHRMFAIASTLTESQAAQARVIGSVSELLLGPGKDARGLFPTAQRGFLAASITPQQRSFLSGAISEWSLFMTGERFDRYGQLYADELDQTYIAISGSPRMDQPGDYVRIDGPHVWIEFLVKRGKVTGTLEYHSVWRDRVTDYNRAFTFG